MWRYRELLPLFDGEAPVTLGEGFTPLFHARALGSTLGLDRLYIRTNRSTRPIRSRRGDSRPRSRAPSILAPRRSRCRRPATPAMPRRPYSAAPVWPVRCSSRRTPSARFIDECRLYGATVTLVDGLITDAGRICAETGGRSAGTTSRR